MRESEEAKRLARRELFKLAGLGSVAGAAVLVGTAREGKAVAKGDAARKGGYRETDHVKTYYTLAKF